MDKKLDNIQALLPFIEYAHRLQKPLLIISEDVESEILATLIINKVRSNLKVSCVKSPSFGDNRKALMQDLAVFTGGQFITEEAGMSFDKVSETPESIKSVLGVAKSVTITKDDTIILHGQGTKDAVKERVETIS